MRGKIIDIHKQDAFYEDLDLLAGKTGEFEDIESCRKELGYVHSSCTLDQPVDYDGDPCTHFIFYAVKIEPLPEEK